MDHRRGAANSFGSRALRRACRKIAFAGMSSTRYRRDGNSLNLLMSYYARAFYGETGQRPGRQRVRHSSNSPALSPPLAQRSRRRSFSHSATRVSANSFCAFVRRETTPFVYHVSGRNPFSEHTKSRQTLSRSSRARVLLYANICNGWSSWYRKKIVRSGALAYAFCEGMQLIMEMHSHS